MKVKFIIDECTGPHVAKCIRGRGFETISIYNDYPGEKDIDILKMANEKGCIVITNDKDFGEMVFKNHLPHKGIILLRLTNERSHHKIEVLEKLLSGKIEALVGSFTVVSERTIRIIKS